MTTKQTGLIRQIDDLGRIVIPKELRRELRVREGDAFELSIVDADGDKALLIKPYRPFSASLYERTARLIRNIKRQLSSNCDVIIVDSNKVYNDNSARIIDDNAKELLQTARIECKTVIKKSQEDENSAYCIIPINQGSEVIAAIIVLGDENAIRKSIPIVESYATAIGIMI